MDGTIEIRKRKIGWGMQVKSWTHRPYAAFIGGKPLKTRGGAIRTFSTRDAARKAAEKAESP
jgi:hypothetical protein